MELLVVAVSPLRKPAGCVLSIVPDGAGPVAQDVIRVMVASARLAVTDVRMALIFMVVLEKQQFVRLSTFNAKFPAFFICRISGRV